MIQQVRPSFFAASAQYRLCELRLAASQKCLHLAETCTLIFVSGGKGEMPGLSRALEPAQGSKVASGRLLLLPVTKKGLFFGP